MEITWQNEKRKVKDLLPAEYNPRRITDKEKQDLEYSLKTWGYVVPVQINTGDRDNVLIGGHQRVGILAALGRLEEEIDVRVPSRELTIEEEKELNVSLNRMGGQFDWTKLFKNFDLDMLLRSGFENDELSRMWDDVDLVDDLDHNGSGREPEEPVVPRLGTGDVYELGHQRLMCGDALNPEHVATLMGEEKADLIWMDAPLEMAETPEETIAKYTIALGNATKHAKENAHLFWWTDERSIGMVDQLFTTAGAKVQRICMWINQNLGLTPKIAFTKLYEPCVYGTIGKPYLDARYAKLNEILNKEVGSGNQVRDEVYDLFNIWLTGKDKSNDFLPTGEKPISVLQKPLRRCTAAGHIVLDLFGGTGGTLMACEQMGRKSRLMETDLVECEKILRRWELNTGKQAKKI